MLQKMGAIAQLRAFTNAPGSGVGSFSFMLD